MEYSQQIDEWVKEMVRLTAIQSPNTTSTHEYQQRTHAAKQPYEQASEISHLATTRHSHGSFCEDQQNYEAHRDRKEISCPSTAPQLVHPLPPPPYDSNTNSQILPNFTLQEQSPLAMYQQNLGTNLTAAYSQQNIIAQQYPSPLAMPSLDHFFNSNETEYQIQSGAADLSGYATYSRGYTPPSMQQPSYPMPSQCDVYQDQNDGLIDVPQHPQIDHGHLYQVASPQGNSSTSLINSPANIVFDTDSVSPPSTVASSAPVNAPSPVTEEKLYNCPIPDCSRLLLTKEIFGHARAHFLAPEIDGKTRVHCKVPGCKTWAQVNNMGRHMKIHLGDILPAWCDICKNYLARGDALRRHSWQEHKIALPSRIRAKGSGSRARAVSPEAVVPTMQHSWKKPYVYQVLSR